MAFVLFVCFNFCTKLKGRNICSYLLNGLPVAAGMTQAYGTDICVTFLLLFLYPFLSSFWCLIEPMCHSDQLLLSVHRSEKYIGVLNLCLFCSTCPVAAQDMSGSFIFSYFFFQWIKD